MDIFHHFYHRWGIGRKPRLRALRGQRGEKFDQAAPCRDAVLIGMKRMMVDMDEVLTTGGFQKAINDFLGYEIDLDKVDT